MAFARKDGIFHGHVNFPEGIYLHLGRMHQRDFEGLMWLLPRNGTWHTPIAISKR